MTSRTYATNTKEEVVRNTAATSNYTTTSLNVLTALGQGIERDTAVLQRMTDGRLVRAGNDLIQLQRSHGNRHVQRIITQAKSAVASGVMIQRQDEPTEEPDTARVAAVNHIHRAAAAGVQGSSGTLPHIDKIQASFGRHDLSNVRAYKGSSAASAAKEIGAHAYTTGNKVAFTSSNPDLYLAAHEAAHVVQQRSGLYLRDGLGQSGDPYEKHADAVATRVVRGQNAALLLDEVASSINKGADKVQTDHQTQVQGDLGFELEVSIPVSEYDPDNGDDDPPNARDRSDDWQNSSVQLPITNNPQTPIWNALHHPVYGVADSTTRWNNLSTQAVPGQLLELVVHHFPTDNLVVAQHRLAYQVRPLLNNIYNYIRLRNPDQYRFHLPGTNTMVGLPNGNDPRDVVDGGHNARAAVSWRTYMQATAGIKLSAIQDTFQQIEDPGNVGETLKGKPKDRQIAQQASTAATNTYNTVSGTNAFVGTPEEVNDIKGFLSLIGLYIRGGEATQAVLTNDNPKNMAPVFLRSAFDQITGSSLTNNARNWLNNNRVELRKNLVRQLRPTVMTTATGGFPYQQQFNLRLFDKVMAHAVPERVGIFVLNALQGNQDTYTRRESKSLVAPENVGATRPAPVMEFRQIDSPGNTPAQWVNKMNDVLQEVHNLNR